jgi:hypothetical protein
MALKRVGIAVLLTASGFLFAAQQDGQSMIAAIKAEGLRGTQAATLFHTLTDAIGPRLTGSPAHVQARAGPRNASTPGGSTTRGSNPFNSDADGPSRSLRWR